MSDMSRVYVLNVPGSSVGHLADWRSTYRTLCSWPTVEAALDKCNRSGVSTFIQASSIPSVRMCKRCVIRHERLTATRTAVIEAVEGAS